MQEDGVNSVKYKLVNIEQNQLFTHVTADVGRAEVRCKTYLKPEACNFVWWTCQYLRLNCGFLKLFSTDDGNFFTNTKSKQET